MSGMRAVLASCLIASAGLSGCSSTEGNVALGVGGFTLFGSRAPAHEIEQTYYLGVFDPQGQIPPAVYRVRVHGQASAISNMRFASGWVPAQVVDSLSTHFGANPDDKQNPNIGITSDEKYLADLNTGRRFVVFGPEGFRTVPKEHRLVIVMGQSPNAFFEGVEMALGDLASFRAAQSDTAIKSKLFEDLLTLKAHRQRLDDLAIDTERAIGRVEGSS